MSHRPIASTVIAAVLAVSLACGGDGSLSPEDARLNRQPDPSGPDTSLTGPPPEPPPPPPEPVDNFDLLGSVRGAEPGPDTLNTVPVAGAIVRLEKVTLPPPSDSGRTPPPPPPAPPVLVGETTTDAGGNFTFLDLPPGTYRLTVIPPAGSPYAGRDVTFTPSIFDPEVPIVILLFRTP